jgi:hypothetical protein
MADTGLNGEVFVNRSLQVVVASYVRAQWRPIRGHYVMRRDLWTAASIVKLERGVDVTAGTVDVHFASCGSAIAQDCVAKRLGAGSVSCPQMRDGEKQSGQRCETKREHSSVLCQQIMPPTGWKIGSASRKRADCWLFASDGQTESNPPITKAGFTVLPTLDGDNWRNQSSAASKFAVKW